MSTYKLVLTGGPCGGKTSSIDFLSKRLKEEGYTVTTIDETANSLLSLGYAPNDNITAFDFQNLLFKLQFLKEYTQEGKTDILICDRGLFDGKVYINDSDFNKILKSNEVTYNEVLSTYNAALYFKSIAYEYPDLFSKLRIYETPTIGIERDKKCLEVWQSKIIPTNYDNLDGIEKKQELIFQSLIKNIRDPKKYEHYDLSHYYNESLYSYINEKLDNLLTRNNISDDIKVKTKKLIR